MPTTGTQYLVLLYGAPQHMPQAICGKSRKTYGWALFDRRLNAHTLQIPADVWDPDPIDRTKKGAGKDIMENTRRRASMNVICQPGIDPRGASVALAEECDRLQTRIAELERDRPLFLQAQGAARTLIGLFTPAGAKNTQAERPGAPVVTVTTSLEKRLDGISYRDLRDVAKRLNGEGMAALVLKDLNSKEKIVAALAGVEHVEKYLPEPEAIAA